MAEKNYYLRQGELGAVMGPKTMVDERSPAWKRLFSIKVERPYVGSPTVVFNFRSIQNASLFTAFVETGHPLVERIAQNPESTPEEAIVLFWNNLVNEVPTLPEEPAGDRIFKLPLVDGTWVLLDLSSVQRGVRNPENVLFYWSVDGESTAQTRAEAHAVFGQTNPAAISENSKQIKDVIDAFLASEHFPKGKVISPVVAHVEDSDDGSKLIAYFPSAPKEEYEVEITSPTGEKFKGVLIIDPSMAP